MRKKEHDNGFDSEPAVSSCEQSNTPVGSHRHGTSSTLGLTIPFSRRTLHYWFKSMSTKNKRKTNCNKT
jgi:hypothetical protein